MLRQPQFIKSRNQDVTEPVIRAATAGMKEADTSLTSVLGDLFAPLPKRRARELGLTEEQEAKYVGRLSRDVDGSGSLDKVVMGAPMSLTIVSSNAHSKIQGASSTTLTFMFTTRPSSGTKTRTSGSPLLIHFQERCAQRRNSR
jgi:hypothetical protein